jgi:hypothetical protein
VLSALADDTPYADHRRGSVGEGLAEPLAHAGGRPWFAVSPTRLHHQCELISDWIDDEVTGTAIPVLPDWVTWLAERTEYAEPFRTRLADT